MDLISSMKLPTTQGFTLDLRIEHYKFANFKILNHETSQFVKNHDLDSLPIDTNVIGSQ